MRPPAETLGAHPATDTAALPDPGARIVLAPCSPSATTSEGALIRDPNQLAAIEGGFVHTNIIEVEFVEHASPAARARVLRQVHGCVIGRDSETVFVRIPGDTTGRRVYEAAAAVSKNATVEFASAMFFFYGGCMMEGPRDTCTEEWAREQIREWRQRFNRGDSSVRR